MRVAGLDEAGAGALAGPVIAAAALYDDMTCPFEPLIDGEGYKDSKQLTKLAREKLVPQLIAGAVSIGLGWADPEEVDRMGMREAHLLCLRRAVGDLQTPPEMLYVDGRAYELSGLPFPQLAENRADTIYWQVAAASVIAKTYRDGIMYEQHAKYDGYGFNTNVGYGSNQHLEALGRLGPTPIHRKLFIRKPMARAGQQVPLSRRYTL